MGTFWSTTLLVLVVTVFGLNSIQSSFIREADAIRERECHGTSNGLSFSGSARTHYFRLRRRYTGCTVVEGNLELNHLSDEDISYDLSFLSTIRVVTGYVLINTVFVDRIPLLSLEQIRGDNLFSLHGKEYSLLVALTTHSDSTRGLRQLLMPSLREIQRGDVLFFHNPRLCYVNTIKWDRIVRGDDQMVQFRADSASHHQYCGPCDDSCTTEGIRRCWGPGSSNCQQDL